MTGEILQAVLNECVQLLNQQTDDKFTGGTCIFKTDWKPAEAAEQMPLILLDMADSGDASQYLGGVTRMDWQFSLNAYSTMPDSYNDQIEDPYATSLIEIIDIIRRHFSTAQALQTWLTSEMYSITETFGFKFTLSGLQRADALQYQTGWIKGWRIVFDSVAIEDETNYVKQSSEVLENVVQIGSTEENELWVPYLQTKNLVVVANTIHTFPKNTFVSTIAMQTAAGVPPPTMKIGTTPGGSEIMAEVEPGNFYLIRPEQYCLDATTFYFTMGGQGIINIRIGTTRNYLPKLIQT